MKLGLERAHAAAERRDFEAVGNELRELESVFRQHIADEEAQILGFLIKQLGVKGAADEIKVFQQHRPIYKLLEEVTELAELSSGELEASQSKLNTLFSEHAQAEEASVFPRAISLHR